MGLFLGMMIARRVGIYFEMKRRTVSFIGWSLVGAGNRLRICRSDADAVVGVRGVDALASNIIG